MLIRGKDRSFTFWFPEDRVIEEITSSNHTYRTLFLCQANCLSFKPDSSSIAGLFKTAKVNFQESKPRANPKEYHIESELGNIKVAMLDSLIVFKSLEAKTQNCNCSL